MGESSLSASFRIICTAQKVGCQGRWYLDGPQRPCITAYRRSNAGNRLKAPNIFLGSVFDDSKIGSNALHDAHLGYALSVLELGTVFFICYAYTLPLLAFTYILQPLRKSRIS